MSMTRCSTSGMPRLRAASTITGEMSVEITCAPALRERLGDVPGAGGEIEDGVAGAGARPATSASATGAPNAVTASRSASQPTAAASQRRRTSSGRLYAATPLNCGRMSLPYASSVSSWPFVIR